MAGAAVSLKLAQEANEWWALLLLPIAMLLLLSYSLYLKCTPLLGNVVVALLCAGVPGLLLYAEPVIIKTLPYATGSQALVAYTVFAFAGTLTRELVKDLEDRRGDELAGCGTLAVRWPQLRLHVLVWTAGFIALVSVAHIGFMYWQAEVQQAALAWAIVWAALAMTIANINLRKPQHTTIYTSVSRHLKWTLALALLMLIYFGRENWIAVG